jgi:hypothetical protein
VPVELDPHNQAISDAADHPVRRRLYGRAAGLAATPLSDAHEDGFPGVDELLGMRVEALEELTPFPQKALDSVRS